ncbi:hypothetical protein CAEBREN_19998 [Caenorhabditis brenneri]|uniref:oxaloacetate tautomerase n=1 Tax=Caenorhabditis brenneri TaxID=135651 RepID=G0P293_CAEBE|nr:hypothetical protein CAEBREN_19998 [Caenorhabditis brenneri]
MRDEVWEYVAGFAAFLDITDILLLADQRGRKNPWALAKSFDHSLPAGKFVKMEDLENPDLIEVFLQIGEGRKDYYSAGLMTFDAQSILQYASRTITLEAGDVVLFGQISLPSPVSHSTPDVVSKVTFGILGHPSTTFTIV